MVGVPKNSGWVIGVDVGGTKVAAGVVDSQGEILCQTRTAMLAHGQPTAGLAAVTSAIDSLTSRCHQQADTQSLIRGIGICSPGPLDPDLGVVINPPNLPCWRNYPLALEVANIYRVPVKLDNDANAAALAEARWGAGRGCHTVFYATIGTGIGTGIVLDGHVYHGRTGAAGEGGHLTIDYRGPRCGCGKPGCIEALAAGPAIAKRARTRILAEGGPASVLLNLANHDIESITSEMVGQAYAAGDLLAKEILEETVDFLSIWLGNIVDLLDPDVIIMGGGVAAMLQPFFGAIKNRLPHWCINSRCQEIPLLMARFGGDAGIVGGAALCSEVFHLGT